MTTRIMRQRGKILHNEIRPIPLIACLVTINKGKILVSKAGDGSYIRPPGGHIEYFEDSETAVRREIKEEVGSSIKNLKLEKVLENFFYFNNLKAHDIYFIYSGVLTNKRLYKKEIVMGDENGKPKAFHWIKIADIVKGKEKLVPKGILEVTIRLDK